jgi:signal transduction histidine kinase
VQLRQTPAPAVRGDVTELERALISLVTNAVRFTPDGGSIVVGLRAADGGAEMSVTDTGIGISEEDRPRVFTEFFRSADPAVQVRPGSGLGLAIVNHIVRRHGGRIEVESALGAGSTFRIWLPAAP